VARSVPVLVVLALLAAACGPDTAPPRREEIEFLSSSSEALRTLPFSEAVRAGDFLFLSGQVGTLPGTLQLAPGGINAEARQALENIKMVLERHGSSIEHVVKCTVFLADMRDWPAFNEVYRQHFKVNFPARSALGASGLALGARVEIECIAFSPAAGR
jgi:2-iminobutanoate/2-iminopropanoate deaminase